MGGLGLTDGSRFRCDYNFMGFPQPVFEKLLNQSQFYLGYFLACQSLPPDQLNYCLAGATPVPLLIPPAELSFKCTSLLLIPIESDKLIQY